MFIFAKTISGKDPINLNTYLNEIKLMNPHLSTRLVVKVNDKLISYNDYFSTQLYEGDIIVILPLLGGG